MPLVRINTQPSRRQLRQFSWLAALMLPLLGWFWGAAPLVLSWLIAGGLVTALIGTVAPELLRWPFVGLSYLTWPIGAVISEILLLIVFFGLFWPLGVWFRWRGRDELRLKLDRSVPSYWEDHPGPRPPADYLRQF